ncbi:MAG: InlB B-repeat-containing protein [Treponema sp.]|nr:InlB B-repeat-containing protein [Treponema sp.]
MKKTGFAWPATAASVALLALVFSACPGPVDNNPAAVSYSVTFDADDGLPEPVSQTVSAGAKATEPSKPDKEGWHFLGWFAEGEETAYDFGKPVNSNLKLKAKWSVVPVFQVSFDADDGEPVPPTQPVPENGYATEPDVQPEKDGHFFLYGFLDDEDEAFAFETTPITADIELKAKWEEGSVVTFD